MPALNQNKQTSISAEVKRLRWHLWQNLGQNLWQNDGHTAVFIDMLSHVKIGGIQQKLTFGDPPNHPKKSDFGRTKAKMGCFSQKCLCYCFGILRWLLSNKNIRNPIKDIWGIPPTPQLTLFWLENGEIWWNQLCRHMCRKISASANGGLSRGSRMHGHESEDPHRR